MPPDNTNACKSNEILGISLEDRKCFPREARPQQNGVGHSKSQTNVKNLEEEGPGAPHRNRSVCSLMDELLCDIYGKEVNRRTSATTCDLSWQDSDYSRCLGNGLRGWHHWKSKDIATLRAEKIRLEKLIAEEGSNLVKHLKRKSVLLVKREAHCDVITAYIQAISTKTREDTKMKFSLSPGAETGFSQWVDAMKMVAQLPGGMPSEFRTKLWLQLSEKHLNDQKVDWERAEAVIFNEWTNPDDEELGVQIVKDLHRTGCSLFCGEQEHNQALLKRVLLAYARWNKNVGYCQGFNMLAALILQVMDKDERNAVKVMIYLIEGVLPESYFANNLRGLSVDMAVFRDLLRLRLPKLSKHLEALQHDTNSGTSYEPPLTNVFTMQWFLTLFSNCLPQQTVLRVWDLVFLYGNEVLLRTALAIWGILQDRVITVESADEFYSIMGVVTREMLEFGLMDANTLVKMIAMVDPFPNELQELREKYLYNISPWTQSVQSAAKKGIRLFYSDQDDQDDTEDEDKIALATAYGVFRRRESTSKELRLSGPTLDISVLKQQYAKLRQRQRQAHVIITAACSSNLAGNLAGNLTAGPSVSVNHLLMGKSALINKGRRIGPPEGSIPPPKKGERISFAERETGKSNRVIQENERNRFKLEKEKGRLKTNHDRTVTEKSVEDSLQRKANRSSSSSSSSSTSTELCDAEVQSDTEEGSQSEGSRWMGANEGCDRDNLKEIREAAMELMREIEEKAEERLRGEEGRSGGVRMTPHEGTIDNTKPIDADIQIQTDNILKPEPEVPTWENVITGTPRPEVKEEVEVGRGKMRRKSDLGLSVIRENLEMLSKFSQKCGGRLEEIDLKSEKDDEDSGRKKELVLSLPEQTEHTKMEQEKAEQMKIEQIKKEQMKMEQMKIEQMKMEQMKMEQMKMEQMKIEQIKKEQMKEQTKEQMKIEQTKVEQMKEQTKMEQMKVEQTKIEEIKNEQMKTEQTKERLKMEQTKEQMETEQVKMEQTKVEQMKEQMKMEQTKVEQIKMEQKKEQMKMEQIKMEQMKAEQTKVEQPVSDRSPISFQEPQTEGRTPIRVRKNTLVEKAISPMTEKPPKTEKVNKEVNTELTFGVDEVEISTRQSKFRLEEEEEEVGKTKLDLDLPTSSRKSRETIFREKDEIKRRIETSKSDWELKMRKIAELETTTREALNEIQAKSMHRKSVHRSLDRNTRRTYLEEGFRSPEKTYVPRIEVDSTEGEVNTRKSKISALSFDEITSRTQKLLGCGEPDKTGVYPDGWKQKSWGSRLTFGEEEDTRKCQRRYEAFSSPTSPEYRGVRYVSPRLYPEEDKDDFVRITENDSRTSVELLDRRYSPERVKPEVDSSRSTFNPFPRRSQSRPKELGVKLGLYPTSPEGERKKS